MIMNNENYAECKSMKMIIGDKSYFYLKKKMKITQLINKYVYNEKKNKQKNIYTEQ